MMAEIIIVLGILNSKLVHYKYRKNNYYFLEMQLILSTPTRRQKVL